MFIILDGASEELTEAVNKEFTRQHDTSDIEEQRFSAIAVVSNSYPYPDDTEDLADIRYRDLVLASTGSRLWSNDPNKEKLVTYAGKLPETDEEIHTVITDAKYAGARADLFDSYGVKYVGRVYLDPRNILLIDNKPGTDLMHESNEEDLKNILSSLHEDWWQDFAIVSSGNVDKLEKFFDLVDYAIPVTYTTGGQSKLKFMGRDFVTVVPPKERNNEKFGLAIRESTNRLSYKLSHI